MDIYDLSVVIKAETSQFSESIKKLKSELESLQKSAEANGGIGSKQYGTFAKQYRGIANAVKQAKKEFESLYKQTVGDYGKTAFGPQLFEKMTGTSYQDTLTAYNQQLTALSQIYEQYNLLSPYIIAEGSIKRQVVSDTITQTDEMVKQAQLGDYIQTSAEERELNEMKIRADLYSQADIQSKMIDNQKKLNKETEKAAVNAGKLKSRLWNIVFYRAIRSVISAITQGISEAFDLLYRFDKEFNNNSLGYNKTISDLKSTFKQLGASITAVLGELLVAFGPIITIIVNGLTKIANSLSALFAALNGKMTYTVANPNYWEDYADSIGDSDKKANKLKKTLASFDELNILSDNSSSSSTSSILPTDMYETRELGTVGKFIASIANAIKQIKGEGWLAKLGLGAAGILGLTGALKGLKSITDLVKTAFGDKNSALSEQTQLETDDAYAIENVLVPALGVLGVAAVAAAAEQWQAGETANEANWNWAKEGALAARTWRDKVKLYVGAGILSILSSIETFKQNASEKIGEFYNNWLTNTEIKLSDTRMRWKVALSSILLGITAFATNADYTLGNLMETIAINMGNALGIDTTNWSNAFDNMGEKLQKWGQAVSDFWANLMNGLGEGITNMVSQAIEKLNAFVAAYRAARDADYANQVSAWKKKVVAAGTLAAMTVGAFVYQAYRKIKIGKASSFLPAYANGGVINTPTVGLVGEYAGARTNPEIITPESKMRSVFAESNEELVMKVDRLTNVVVEILNKDNSITIGDDVISASAARGNMNYKRRTGKSQFAM